MSGVLGSDITADIISTNVPPEVAHPHGRNPFALDDGMSKAAEHDSGLKRAGVEIEPTGPSPSPSTDGQDFSKPTDEELATLRRVAGSLPAIAWLLCVVEFAERASYYGASGVFSNFMEFPLPPGGNGAGATPPGSQETPGALDGGEEFANAFSNVFVFLAYIVPIFGGWLADVHLGRFRTIMIGVLICGVSHIIMICGAIPSLLQAGRAIAPFLVSLFTLAVGAGLFKPNIAPMLLDQYTHQKPYVKALASGERVIVDPESTVQRVMLIFYALVNLGAFYSVATTYAEKDIGYWLAFLLPGIIYFLLPFLLWYLRKRLVRLPPAGSTLNKVAKIIVVTIRYGGWKFWTDEYWNVAKPGVLADRGITTFRGKPISWTDRDVHDFRRALTACMIFLYFPIYNINDGGIGNVATNQGASMTTNGAPNDLLGNINPIAILITVPLLSWVIYPTLRRYNIRVGRITRMTFGFTLAWISGIIGAIVQWKVYQTSPCGYYASDCSIGTGVSPLSIWWQVPNTALGAISECFCNVTAYELAYARAPPSMRGIVMAIFLASTALSAALSLILVPVTVDPYLIWIWAAPAIFLFVQTIIFWFRYKKYNDDEFIEYDNEEYTHLIEAARDSSEHDVESAASEKVAHEKTKGI